MIGRVVLQVLLLLLSGQKRGLGKRFLPGRGAEVSSHLPQLLPCSPSSLLLPQGWDKSFLSY